MWIVGTSILKVIRMATIAGAAAPAIHYVVEVEMEDMVEVMMDKPKHAAILVVASVKLVE